MFSFEAMPVKFVGLLVLFVWCTVWCVYELTRPRQDNFQRVSNSLHLVMAVVMLLMVSRPVWSAFVAVVPLPVVVAFFAASTLWFAGLLVRARRGSDRNILAHFAGHTTMFAAMTWHLAAMAVKRPQMMPQPSGAPMGDMGHDMGQPMGGAVPDPAAWLASASAPGGILWVFALVGVPFMTYLLVAGILDLRRAFRPLAAVNDSCACGTGCTCGPDCACGPAHVRLDEVTRELAMASVGSGPSSEAVTHAVAQPVGCHEERPVGTPVYRMSALADFAMNFGMFWMSTGLMTALLTFFSYLSF